MRGLVPPGVGLGAYANNFNLLGSTSEAEEAHHHDCNDHDAALPHNPEYNDECSPASYLSLATQWKHLGADIIGGCCGVFPEHVAALHALNHNAAHQTAPTASL